MARGLPSASSFRWTTWNGPPRPAASRLENLAGGTAIRPFPDYTRMSHREYGHRVGIFRVLDALEKAGIPATVAMDALTAENYPYLVRHCLDRGCEIIAHGQSASRMITSNMTEQEERAYIQESFSAITRATGATPQGWLGPEYGESERTPQLLAQEGIRYVCDWANDEQPYPIKSPSGEIFALPILWELDDVGALSLRKVTVHRYGQMLTESFRSTLSRRIRQRPRPSPASPPLAHRPALPHRLPGASAGPHDASAGCLGSIGQGDCGLAPGQSTGGLTLISVFLDTLILPGICCRKSVPGAP